MIPAALRLWHISEQCDIEVFVPRTTPGANAKGESPVVWAVDGTHLASYLVPRDCPRVAFHALPDSTGQDRQTLLGFGGARHVVAIESGWLERAARGILWAYEFPLQGFVCADATAGYFVSSVAVVPISRRRVDDPLSELVASGVELRVVPDLHALAARVASSSLAFSCIRMRNAGAAK